MLTLHDPLETIRAQFREVWELYFAERHEEAEFKLDGITRDLNGEASSQPVLTPQELQSILIQEKHRLEDIRRTVELMRRHRPDLSAQAASTPPAMSPSAPREPAGNATAETRSATGGQHKPAPGGGLDLAGMIDAMLDEERNNR
ncbi:hypothetical protein [Coraliomargarita parva]|uniref:hypothetical protein n=1 Tax=Coraliomargarita parva TaxID=3014050 RepID=UPI0022B5421E|nr:hypothetical protein [Coraliomargarita parva]